MGWLADLSPAFAAVAAGASWASVAQSRRERIELRKPNLHAQLLLIGNSLRSERSVSLTVHNAGHGIAKQIGYVVASGGRYALGFLNDGFLRPGETAHVATFLVASDAARAVVLCLDVEGRALAWDAEGRRKRLGRPARGTPTTAAVAWSAFYGDRLADMEHAGSVEGTMAPPSGLL